MCYGYWKNRNFPYLTPKFPKGNNLRFFAPFPGPHLESWDYYKEIRNKGYKFAGIYSVVRPILIVADPKIIKDILVKDFDYFMERGFYGTESDPLSITLLSMGEDKWKSTRGKLTNVFTLGKIKGMIPCIEASSMTMIRAIDECAKQKLDIDMIQMATKFTTVNLCRCFLGLEVDDSDDIFMNMVHNVFIKQTFVGLLKRTCVNVFPDFSKKIANDKSCPPTKTAKPQLSEYNPAAETSKVILDQDQVLNIDNKYFQIFQNMQSIGTGMDSLVAVLDNISECQVLCQQEDASWQIGSSAAM
ncbi:hypothetical protein JTB14_034701 [Gonioctena quinquepunctata]|nr:hypothetical protein JTB14_034701 [Gonioctena quinquepunctata]